MRVGVAAADAAVALGLERVFARQTGVHAVRLPDDPRADAQATAPDVLVVDVWPPTEAAAARMCAAWHERFPTATILAIVHRPTDPFLRRLSPFGVRALWPKGDARGLVAVAVSLMPEQRAGAPRA